MKGVIAEIGVNHNNSKSLLEMLIRSSAASGAKFIKFQKFFSAQEISSKAPLAKYQESSSYQSQLEMALALEMPDHLLKFGVSLCNEVGIVPICSAFDLQSLEFISHHYDFSTLKIPSPEISNIPFLRKAATLYDSIILSTGASDLWEVAYAVDILLSTNPLLDLTLLHCVSQYPAPLTSLNLRSISTLSSSFNLPVGFSDHSLGFEASICALSLGACLIEKHVTTDRSLPGPDHQASSTFDELSVICKFADNVDDILGDGVKKTQEAELPNKALIRKSVYVNVQNIEKGTVLQENMLSCKRPYNPGLIDPYLFDKVIGKPINRSLSYDDGLSLECIDW